MKNQLQVFAYDEKIVRTVIENNEPWWVLKDVCNVLGIENPSYVRARLDHDEVGSFDLPHPQNPAKRLKMTCISESGLYGVVLRSDKPEARKFRRFVTHEILPSIRKHGLYAVDGLIENPDLLITALRELKSERAIKAGLVKFTAFQERQIAEMLPKAGYHDAVLSCKGAVPISVIAKDYGWSARRMNAFLHECGVQYKQSAIWLLYQKHAGKGYADSETRLRNGHDGTAHAEIHARWTQAGRLFIYNLMKAEGHLPLVERNGKADGSSSGMADGDAK